MACCERRRVHLICATCASTAWVLLASGRLRSLSNKSLGPQRDGKRTKALLLWPSFFIANLDMTLTAVSFDRVRRMTSYSAVCVGYLHAKCAIDLKSTILSKPLGFCSIAYYGCAAAG
eukprot:3576140-Amphidinium_carterae.1